MWHPVDMSDAGMCWSALAEPWRRCILLAWDSLQSGDMPVGAVVVDPAGTVVGSGRTRQLEQVAPAGQLAGTRLAHAEVNALAVLPPADYRDHTMYTSLEPCLLCTAALTHSHIGTVRFGAVDPLWDGLHRLPEINEHVALRWTTRIGPLGGPIETLAGLLPLATIMERNPDHRAIASFQRDAAWLVDLARQLVHTRLLGDLRRMPLADGLDRLWDHLGNAQTVQQQPG
jgi:tRNA(adenine34) deaminase